MHLRSGLRPEPRWWRGSFQRSPRSPSWWGGARCPSPRTRPLLSAFGLEFRPLWPYECNPRQIPGYAAASRLDALHKSDAGIIVCRCFRVDKHTPGARTACLSFIPSIINIHVVVCLHFNKNENSRDIKTTAMLATIYRVVNLGSALGRSRVSQTVVELVCSERCVTIARIGTTGVSLHSHKARVADDYADLCTCQINTGPDDDMQKAIIGGNGSILWGLKHSVLPFLLFTPSLPFSFISSLVARGNGLKL